MDNSKIEWTDATWNPVRGCSIVSKGCTNCYAMKVAHRFSGTGKAYDGLTMMSNAGPVWNGKIKLVPELLDQPLRWKRPRKIFVNSMSDLFHEDVPNDFINKVFDVMEACSNAEWVGGEIGWEFERRHTFQILTKRPERMQQYVCNRLINRKEYAEKFKDCPTEDMRNSPVARLARIDAASIRPNIWLGVSVEDQKSADERIPLLLQTPAAVRWVSAEPLLGPVDLTHISFIGERGGIEDWNALDSHGKSLDGGCDAIIDWVVVGGESGPGARPMHPDWARALRDQCNAAGVKFFFKQWGEWTPGDAPPCPESADYAVELGKGYYFDNLQWMDRVGKKAAGRILDGRTWDEYPV